MQDLIHTVFESIFGLETDEYAFFTKKYSEPHRHYHTLEHIGDCLQKLNEVKSEAEDLKSIQTAILYHDIFYDPHRKDNEEKSANYAFKLLKKKKFKNAAKVKKLILLTKHPSNPVSEDEKFLLDIDLSILGAKPEKYAVYEENIRKEYIQVPKDLYSKGRSRLLIQLLESEQIFQTLFFKSKYETQARINLDSALKAL